MSVRICIIVRAGAIVSSWHIMEACKVSIDRPLRPSGVPSLNFSWRSASVECVSSPMTALQLRIP